MLIQVRVKIRVRLKKVRVCLKHALCFDSRKFSEKICKNNVY